MLDKVLKFLGIKKEQDLKCASYIGKSVLPVSSTFLGMGATGRYVHRTDWGRATYSPAYYAIDGRLLQTHL